MTLGAVLLAALVGSAHCGLMCGAFAAACGPRPGPSVSYHAGRLLGYVALGAVAGLAGAGLNLAGAWLLGAQRVAGLIMAVVLFGMAARVLWPPRPRPVRIAEPRARPSLRGRFSSRQDRWGALGIGLLSALLPCGWLWGFVFLAAATGGLVSGAAVMGAFWAGTVPVLLVVGGLVGRIGVRLRRWARPAVATALLGAGLLSLSAHWLPRLALEPAARQAAALCHAP